MLKHADPRTFTPSQRQAYVDQALKHAKDCMTTAAVPEAVYPAFSELLSFIVIDNWLGGCHDTSAVLHMLLAEAGIESTLCIGEVGVGTQFLDHSWVEVGGLIYDAAVCMPQEGGKIVSGPVFASIDLEANVLTSLRYGVDSGLGIGVDAQPALHLDLQGFANTQPDQELWILVVALASRIGHEDPTFAAFKSRYSKVRRTLRR